MGTALDKLQSKPPVNAINFYYNHCRNNGPLGPKPQIDRGSGTKIGTPLSLFYYHTYENH